MPSSAAAGFHGRPWSPSRPPYWWPSAGGLQAQQNQQQANQQMLQILQEEEMEAERYSNIASAINVDDELRERFEQLKERLLEEEEDGPPSLMR